MDGPSNALMSDHADHPETFNQMLGVVRSTPDDAFPEEAFACPHCGQMLGPGCRVCVACKAAINPADIRKSGPIFDTAAPISGQPEVARARFSWPIFFIVLGISWAATTVALQYLELGTSQLLIGAMQVISSAWVIFDAHQKRVAKPLRWGLGSLFLWIVIFPWYLARRRTPEAPCPFVEAEATPRARVLVVALALIFLAGLIVVLIKGPPA